MDSVRRPFVLKAIAFFLAVTVFATLFPSGLPVHGSTPEASMILKAAETIYQNNSELLAWARFTIIGG